VRDYIRRKEIEYGLVDPDALPPSTERRMATSAAAAVLGVVGGDIISALVSGTVATLIVTWFVAVVIIAGWLLITRAQVARRRSRS
jgi:hypothetical protein